MFGKKKRNPKGLYYLFPVSSKALKKKYRIHIWSAIAVGLVISGIMFALLYLLNT